MDDHHAVVLVSVSVYLFCHLHPPHIYVEDISRIGTHSLRSGGAKTAARAGVPDRLFQCHGRWRSENVKDGYVEDSLQERLRVAKSLGI